MSQCWQPCLCRACLVRHSSFLFSFSCSSFVVSHFSFVVFHFPFFVCSSSFLILRFSFVSVSRASFVVSHFLFVVFHYPFLVRHSSILVFRFCYVLAFVRVRARACVRVCVRVCVRAWLCVCSLAGSDSLKNGRVWPRATSVCVHVCQISLSDISVNGTHIILTSTISYPLHVQNIVEMMHTKLILYSTVIVLYISYIMSSSHFVRCATYVKQLVHFKCKHQSVTTWNKLTQCIRGIWIHVTKYTEPPVTIL